MRHRNLVKYHRLLSNDPLRADASATGMATVAAFFGVRPAQQGRRSNVAGKANRAGWGPHAVAPSLMALAGLWENWRSPASDCAASRSSPQAKRVVRVAT